MKRLILLLLVAQPLLATYSHMNAGDLAVERKDNEGALREYSKAAEIAATTPGIASSRIAEMFYGHAVALVSMNRVDDPKLLERIRGAR
jgi:hypothetical protein